VPVLEEPLDNFTRSIQRVRRLLLLHQSLHGKRGRPQQQVSDVLRGATVLAAGALDGLVLEVVVAATPGVAKKGELGPTAEKWVEADAKRVLGAFAKEDPHQELASLVRDKLARTTFQKSAMIEANLRDIIGVPAPWQRAAITLSQSDDDSVEGEWTADEVKDALDEFMLRRDRIAHSGDQKAGSTGATPIKRDWVSYGVSVVEAVGEAICAEVEETLA